MSFKKKTYSNTLGFWAFLALALAFSSCADRFNYEPKKTYSNNFKNIKKINSYILSSTQNGASLQNRKFITNDINSDYKLPKGFYFLNYNNDILLASDKKQQLLVYKLENKLERIFNVKGYVVGASIKDDIVSLLFSDNSIGVYDTSNRIFLLKEYLTKSSINSNKFANPIYYKNTIFFGTLDGKVVVTNNNKILNKISIAQTGLTKNIIFIYYKKNTIVVATNNKILSLQIQEKKVNKLDIDIKDIKIDNNYIYVASLQGDVFRLNMQLKKLNSKKFKFANFYTLGVGDKYIWVLEQNDFIIRIDKNFNNFKVFNFSFDDKEKTIALKNKLYFDDKMIPLP